MVATRPARLAVLAAALLAACSSGGGNPAARHPAAGRSAAAASSPSPMVAQPCTDAPAVPAAPTGAVSSSPLWTIASGLNQPDDLLFHDGQLYVGELGAGGIDVMAPGRPSQRLPLSIPEAEGIAFIGSTMYVADQQNDRVDAVEGNQVRTLIQLTPVPGQDGVDGIAALGNQVVVPDSPRGVVDFVDTSGQVVRSVGGFSRPTGAWPMPDGSVLIADENAAAVVRLAPDGTRTYLTRSFPIADDVVADSAGNVFAVAPVATGGRLTQVVGGSLHDLASRLAAPQGLALDDAGNLYFSEEGAGRVDLLIRSFKIEPLASPTPVPGHALCIDVLRAPGFTGDIELSGTGGLQVTQQPGAGTQGAVLPSSCRQSPCQVVARGGGGSDALWLP
jgi:DNA-binding beta-propeller fold protein YncE